MVVYTETENVCLNNWAGEIFCANFYLAVKFEMENFFSSFHWQMRQNQEPILIFLFMVSEKMSNS